MASLFLLPTRPVFTPNGVPIPGARIFFYQSGTLIPVTVYADADLATPLANPVIANAAAQIPPIYLRPDALYRIRIETSAGVLVDDIDPYAPGDGTADLSAAAITAALGYTPASNDPLTELADAFTPVDFFSDSGNALNPKAGKALRLDQDGPHTDGGRYASHTLMVTEGCGTRASPSTADVGNTIAMFRRQWQSNTAAGEMDGLYIVGRNGIGDMGGILVDVGARDGFAVMLEGAARELRPDASFVKSVQSQVGVVDSHEGTAFGFAAIARVGVIDQGYLVQADGGTFTNAFQNNANGLTNFAVDANTGAVKTLGGIVVGAVRDPFATLDVVGSIQHTGGPVSFGASEGTTDVVVSLGNGRVAQGNAYLDFYSMVGSTVPGLRLLRTPEGETQIRHRGTGPMRLVATENGSITHEVAGTIITKATADSYSIAAPLIGFFGAVPSARPAVTGSRGGNAALASLLTALAGLGLITNGTDA